MDKRLTFWGATGFVVLYFVAVFAAEFIGFAHPVCWVLAPALGALLGALPYRWLSLRWHRFGLGTVLSAVFGLLMMAMGEVDLTRLAVFVGCGVLSDLVRLDVKKDAVTLPAPRPRQHRRDHLPMDAQGVVPAGRGRRGGTGLCRLHGSAAEHAVARRRLGGHRRRCRMRIVDSKENN